MRWTNRIINLMLTGGERAPALSPPDPTSPGKYAGLPPLKLPLINKDLVPMTWYQGLGTKDLVSGTRYQVPGTRYQVSGIRYQVSQPQRVYLNVNASTCLFTIVTISTSTSTVEVLGESLEQPAKHVYWPGTAIRRILKGKIGK